MRGRGVGIGIDFGELEAGLRAMSSIGHAVSDEKTNNIVEAVTADSAEAIFENHVDELAQRSPQRYHHLYEWGQLGQASGRLFNLRRGRMGGDSTLDVEWIASMEPVPKTGDRSRHIFVWKAPVMEMQGEAIITVGNPYRRVETSSHGPAREYLHWGNTFTRGPVTVSYASTNNALLDAWDDFWYSGIADNTINDPVVTATAEVINNEGSAYIQRASAAGRYKPRVQPPRQGVRVQVTSGGKSVASFNASEPNPGIVNKMRSRLINAIRRF